MALIDYSDAPEDLLERAIWMGGIDQALRKEVNAELQRIYYELRLQGRLKPALDLRLHGKKKVLAWTRAENDLRGRPVTAWPDREEVKEWT